MTRALVISARDNVATALETLEPGQLVELGGRHVTVRDRIPAGHKVAIAAIAAGHEVVKYGSAIGTATIPIGEGAHVHTHNVASTRGRGDLVASSVPRPTAYGPSPSEADARQPSEAAPPATAHRLPPSDADARQPSAERRLPDAESGRTSPPEAQR